MGSLRFESSDREWGFLAEAGNAFSFPLMEKRLMGTGMENMLQCAQDLALKSFVASRSTARQLRAESAKSSQLAELE